jgi:hypothetical protein
MVGPEYRHHLTEKEFVMSYFNATSYLLDIPGSSDSKNLCIRVFHCPIYRVQVSQ